MAIKNESVSCAVVASRGGYDVLYMEALSNWRGAATKLIMEQSKKCLLFTVYKEYLICSTTTGFSGQRDKKARHVIIEQRSLKKFTSHIKKKSDKQAGKNVVDAIHIDTGVQDAIRKFSEYNDAFKEFGENLGKVIKNTKKAVNNATKGNEKYRVAAQKFLKNCRDIINEDMKENDIEDMLVQHILTSRIFAMVYDDEDFHQRNTVARSLEQLRGLLNLSVVNISYEKIELIAESITESDQKQEFLKKVYETYYKRHDPERAKKEGIVYTPSEVVNFMVKSVNHVLKTNFEEDLSSGNVTILDPCTGTGTFLVHVLRELGDKNLDKKYDQIHANEISILPYYIAALNIENTYREMTSRYREFENICWMDTLDGGMKDYGKMSAYFEGEGNVERIRRQQKTEINVVIGNPPYSVAQNKKYAEFDKKIEATYVKRTKELAPDVGQIRALYDSYMRFFRWASTRIDKKGVVAFVSNGSFLTSEVGAGVRACLEEEFTDVWVFNLRGNALTQGEKRKREGGNVFGSNSKTPVAITILLKNPKVKKCTIYYRDIGDYLNREEKLKILNDADSIRSLEWQVLKPDKHHEWLNKRNSEFLRYMPLSSKSAKSGKSNPYVVCSSYSSGVKTARDVWVYNSSKNELEKNVKDHIDYCNKNIHLSAKHYKKIKVNNKYNWDEVISTTLRKYGKQKFDQTKIRSTLYRPFFKQNLYFDQMLNQRQSLFPYFFPEIDSKNLVISIPYKFNKNFHTLITNTIPDLQVVFNGQYFPLYTYKNSKRNSNITEHALKEYHRFYNDKKIQDKDIFYYIYGLLHHQGYQQKFKNNLTKTFPTIPLAPDFWKINKIGRDLANLHLNFEDCTRYSLNPKFQPKSFSKLNFAKKAKKLTSDGTYDLTKIKTDGGLLFENIPDIKYRVNGRTPIEWIVDRYKKTTDKKSGITNDPCTGTDIVAVIERAVHVGLESDKLIEKLSKLPFEPSEKDKPPMPEPAESKSAVKPTKKSSRENRHSKSRGQQQLVRDI